MFSLPLSVDLMAFDGTTLLGSISGGDMSNNSGVEDGTNPFIGLQSTAADITSVEFLSNNFGNHTGDFAIGTTYLADGNSVPEPAAWTMFLIGFGWLGALSRTRRVQRQASEVC